MKRFVKPVLGILIFVVLQVGLGMLLPFILKEQGPRIWSSALIISGLLTVAILYRMRLIRRWSLYPTDIKWKNAFSALGAGVLAIVATTLFTEQLDLTNSIEMQQVAMSRNKIGVFTLVLFGPIVEELVFREAWIGYLTRHRVPRVPAILSSAIIFALIHFNLAQIPYAFIMGLVFGVIYVKTRSVVITSMIHILNNAISVWLIRRMGSKASDFRLTDVLGGEEYIWYLILFCAILCVIFLRDFYKRYHYSHHKAKKNHHHHHHHHHQD